MLDTNSHISRVEFMNIVVQVSLLGRVGMIVHRNGNKYHQYANTHKKDASCVHRGVQLSYTGKIELLNRFLLTGNNLLK